MIVSRTVASLAVLIGFLAGTAVAVNIETVTVGDPGNAGEWSGAALYYWPDLRICGAVSYTYRIGKYEVTQGQYTEFLNKVAATDPYGLYNTDMADTRYLRSGISRSGAPGSYTYSVDPAFVNRPVNVVSFWDAARFANWLHNGQPTGASGPGSTETGTYTLNGYNGTNGRTIQRNPGAKWALPTEDEWYKAAYYKGGSTNAGYWDYPTRSNTHPGRELNDASGNNANYTGDPNPIQSPYYTTVVGQFQNSAGPYGTFDQGGNVGEWIETTVDVDDHGNSDGIGRRGWRGGAYGIMGQGHGMLASQRFYASPMTESVGWGFRVVQVPEPSTMAILAWGAIGLLVRRRGLGR